MVKEARNSLDREHRGIEAERDVFPLLKKREPWREYSLLTLIKMWVAF